MDRLERLEHPVEALKVAMEGSQASIWTTLPGIINSFDPATMTATVRPAIQIQYTDKETGITDWHEIPLLLDVPVVIQSSGGISITLPINAGDECLVSFSARCIDAWWAYGGVQKQAEYRMHDLSDGFAFIGPKSIPNVLSNYSTTSAQIRNGDQSLLIDLNPSTKAISITASSLTINCPVTVNSTVTATGNVTGNGTSLHTHTHSDPQGGNTGFPN